MRLAELVGELLGPDPPVAVELHDGSVLGPADAPARLVFRSPDVLRRLLTAPGELGFARAYVAGELDVEGDVYAALALQERLAAARLSPRQWVAVLRLVRREGLRPLPPPAEEADLRGRRHSRERDAAAVAHHYDVSNRFYRLVLGPSLTYSCAVFAEPFLTLEEAQAAKHELVCAKLGVEEGMRLLDVGCGWGSLLIHAAEHHGVEGLGVTLSRAQAELARERIAEAGLADRVEVRLADYRDLRGERFDAISSIGMFEHVGRSQLAAYFRRLYELVRPGGRLLNHGISRPPGHRPRFGRRGFVQRYVFPDGELHEIGSVVSTIQRTGFEARHVESLREHYGLTLRRRVANLEEGWEEAVAEVGPARARIWRLYMAGSALGFEAGRLQVHQVLTVRAEDGRSRLPLRPGAWEREEAGA
ncbi:MAG: class I SAM-dependent methyltransferase [Gaiellaceae bacterium]